MISAKITKAQLKKIKQFANVKGLNIDVDNFNDFGDPWEFSNHIVIFKTKNDNELATIEKRTYTDGTVIWTDVNTIYVKKLDELLRKLDGEIR